MLYKIFDSDTGAFIEWANFETPAMVGEMLTLTNGQWTVSSVGEPEVNWENNKLFQKLEVKRAT